MPTLNRSRRKLDVKALEAHLRSIGLVPNSMKWIAVWHRKKNRFLV